MKRSGCSLALLAGTEGYSAEPSDVSLTLEQVGRLTALCRQGGLPFTLAIGCGTPGETRTTVDQKLSFLHQAAPAFATLRVASRVLPHTPLAKLALEEGLIQAEADLLRPTFYLAAGVRDWACRSSSRRRRTGAALALAMTRRFCVSSLVHR